MTMIVSLVFFLFASAFTLVPSNNNYIESNNVEQSLNHNSETKTLEVEILKMESGCNSGCCTCTFGSGGAPNGCKNAAFCGLTQCTGLCDQSGGDPCGECTDCLDPTVPCQA